MAAAGEPEQITSVLDGERRAFDALFDTFLPAAWRLAASRCRERGGAEALARAILVHACRHLDDRPGERPIAWWLDAIADEVGARRRAPAPDPSATPRHTGA